MCELWQRATKDSIWEGPPQLKEFLDRSRTELRPCLQREQERDGIKQGPSEGRDFLFQMLRKLLMKI